MKTMKVLVVGTGRSGTLSLTKWFNDFFKCNKIIAQAVHEYLARECYQALDDYFRTKSDTHLKAMAAQCYFSKFEVIVGNGYGPLLPYFTNIDTNIILIHLQRRDRHACISSFIRNAEYYPTAHKYYVSEIGTPRTTAFHVGQTTEEDWMSWSLEKKFGWYYDYTHSTITKHAAQFAKHMHFFTEDLNDADALTKLAKFCFPNFIDVPLASKLNSHFFAKIEDYPPNLRPIAQWLLGNIDWQRIVIEPSYFVTYAMGCFETLVGWCESGRIDDIFPHTSINKSEISAILENALPILKRSITILDAVILSYSTKGTLLNEGGG